MKKFGRYIGSFLIWSRTPGIQTNWKSHQLATAAAPSKLPFLGSLIVRLWQACLRIRIGSGARNGLKVIVRSIWIWRIFSASAFGGAAGPLSRWRILVQRLLTSNAVTYGWEGCLALPEAASSPDCASRAATYGMLHPQRHSSTSLLQQHHHHSLWPHWRTSVLLREGAFGHVWDELNCLPFCFYKTLE